MNQAVFRFYSELNDFLVEELRQKRFDHRFWGEPGIKDVIESFGPPHTEIDLILVNHIGVAFDYGLQDGDQVSVYPLFRTLDLGTTTSVRPPGPETIRFVLDSHLGRLSAYLRMLGFDSLYWNDVRDDRLAQTSHSDKRILLTRDRGLLKRSSVVYGYCVRATQPRAQLTEVVRRFDLLGSVRAFKRCMRCNRTLRVVEKAAVVQRLPEGVRDKFESFRICPGCERVYWRGSHYSRMRQLIDNLADELSDQR